MFPNKYEKKKKNYKEITENIIRKAKRIKKKKISKKNFFISNE